MERSVGTDALLNESWTTPWLDEAVFPYWPEAARIGNLEDFLRWLAVQDGRRAALVLTHAWEFEKVHHLVTTELSGPAQRQKQQRQQQRQQRQPRRNGGSPPRLSETNGTGAQGRDAGGQTLTPTGNGGGKARGSGGKARVGPSRNNNNNTGGGGDGGGGGGALSLSLRREPWAAARNKRVSATIGGGGRGRDRSGSGGVAPSMPERDPSRSWPPGTTATAAAAAAAAAAGNKQYGLRDSRGKTASIVPPPPAMRSSTTRRGATPLPQQTPAWSSSTSIAAAVIHAPRRSAPLRVARGSSRKGSRFEDKGGVAGVRKSSSGGGSNSNSSTGGGGSGFGSRGGSRLGAGGSASSNGSGSGGGGGLKAIDGSAYVAKSRRGPSWGAMTAAVVAAAAAADRVAAAREAVEQEAAEAAAAASANLTETSRGKRGRGVRSPEKYASGRTGGLARRLPRRSSPPRVAWSKSAGSGGDPDDTDRLGNGAKPVHDRDLPRAGNDTRGTSVRPAGQLEEQHPVRFQHSPRFLGDIDEEKEADLEAGAASGGAGTGGDKTSGSESWLCMRDPVTLREFWFDPETRAAEWEGGGAMEDTPGGMGLGLLSKEDRERLRGKFERRQRRVRRSSGAGTGGGGGGGVGGPRGTAGLREQVLRKLTLEGDGAGAGATGAAPAAPVQRGAATHGVFFA